RSIARQQAHRLPPQHSDLSNSCQDGRVKGELSYSYAPLSRGLVLVV
uniref:Uncharacterized protein n=1 Tax=Aegilops tauschii subsp. strangulata TaxID=200361 RepID=A0A453FIN1_AEGTS